MNQFTIRVYGIWINNRHQILLSDERIGDFQFTKFPGGGLEFGEGIKDCLKREWNEELGVDIEVLNHIYTTDFFQSSAFDSFVQVISVYYKVKPIEEFRLVTSGKPFNFSYKSSQEESFRWEDLANVFEEHLTFPIDKKVLSMVKFS